MRLEDFHANSVLPSFGVFFPSFLSFPSPFLLPLAGECCAWALGPLLTPFIEPPLFLCQTTFIQAPFRLPLFSRAFSCPHPGPPFPHTRSLPVHATAGGQPSGCSLFHPHGGGTKCRKCGKNKHVLQHEEGELDGTPVASLITLRDGQHLPQAQPGFDMPWAALQPSSHFIPCLLSLSLFPCLRPHHFHCNQNALTLSFL